MTQGLIDIHFHGQAGFDVMSDNPEDLLGLSRHLKAGGVAGFLATFVSSSKEEFIKSLETVKKLQGTEKGATILGVHLEGPFLHPERKGAHNPRHLRPPDLTDPRVTEKLSDDYLLELIKNGGAALGKPGMPAFGFHLSDTQIRDLITYIRAIPRR